MLTIVCRKNTTLKGTPGKVDPESIKLPPNEDLPPAEVDQDLEEVAYVDRVKEDKGEDEVDDDWDDLTNDAALDDLQTLNINLKYW